MSLIGLTIKSAPLRNGLITKLVKTLSLSSGASLDDSVVDVAEEVGSDRYDHQPGDRLEDDDAQQGEDTQRRVLLDQVVPAIGQIPDYVGQRVLAHLRTPLTDDHPQREGERPRGSDKEVPLPKAQRAQEREGDADAPADGRNAKPPERT